MRFTDTLDLEGLLASIGSVGDTYDNAVAESVFGLYKNEAIRADSPFRTGPLRTIVDVEEVTLNWVTWFNHQRLHTAISDRPPIDAEKDYYQHSAQTRAAT